MNKHAMHLIRLYLLCLDILEKEDIVTYRGDDLPLLMSIRKGDYQLEDGTYRPEFLKWFLTLKNDSIMQSKTRASQITRI